MTAARSRERASGTIARGRLVVLRSPRAGDGPELTRVNRASARLHRGLVRPPRTAADFARYLARSRRPDAVCLLICRREDGAVAGSINLSEIVRGAFQSAYVGYYIAAPFARQGLMRAALRLVLRHAFGRLGLHRVEANIQPGNTPSLGLVRRAGFTREGFSRRYLKIAGRWRDHERWALLRESWLASRSQRRGERTWKSSGSHRQPRRGERTWESSGSHRQPGRGERTWKSSGSHRQPGRGARR